MAEDTAKYKDMYLSEAKEHLAGLNKSLLKLEKNPTKLELVSDMFREAHTLKSMSATMGYTKISELCHSMEDVLDKVKKKEIRAEEVIDTLFEYFDALEADIKQITNPSLAPSESAGGGRVEGVERIQTVEVKVERLDILMNLAEELLINKMRLDGIKEKIQDPELSAAVDSLGRLISDIQFNIMQSRMVPMGFIFDRFPRMLRDLAKQEKKEINLIMEGADIELDRGVIDEIGESLVHLLRNSLDHGIESPEERKKAGKPAQGTIKLTATRTKGFAVIEVADDGGGMDFESLKNTAIKRGIISAGASKEEVMDSIFSGVSTTKQVTAVSGRGFGLNIVKKKIETLGGNIKVESELKKGTKFIIEIPLTLAIIKTLFVAVGSKTYAVPLVNIERLVTIKKEEIKGMLQYEAIVLDEEDVPITRLNVLFELEQTELDSQPIVVIRKGEEKLGLAVDALMATEEIVIKPLSRLVRENKYFAGSSIIGSGEVVLILDVANLILSKRQKIKM